MLSNLNQQPMDGLNGSIHITNKFHNVNSHSTKNDALEFSIYRPDVDFSVNYEPVGEKKVSRLVNDAKDASAAPKNGENGRRAVMTMTSYDPTNLHNYSKVPQDMTFEGSDNNNNKNVNGALSEAEDGQRDDNNNPSNKVDDKKPEHHVSHSLRDCRVIVLTSASFLLSSGASAHECLFNILQAPSRSRAREISELGEPVMSQSSCLLNHPNS
jgi:hypothetical protein